MGANTLIEWCLHTLNLWWGCSEVHAGCDHCYARTFARAKGRASAWKGDRFAIQSAWANATKWQEAAAKAGELHRVFCGSMMDIFEKPLPAFDWHGKPLNLTTGDLRDRYFRDVIPATPNLMHMLLTKRPGNAPKYVPAEWLSNWPENVITGASIADQASANAILPRLVQTPGPLFVSAEPLLTAVDLTPWLDRLALVIVGGESGHGARPMNVRWVRDLRDQCQAAGTPYFMKQWGEWIPFSQLPKGWSRSSEALHAWGNDGVSYRVGKKAAGRLLDGRTWDELPTVATREPSLFGKD